MQHQYEVIVGNIDSVYAGTSKREAERTYRNYVDDSKENYGRAAGEDVTLMCDGEIAQEFQGEISKIEGYIERWNMGDLDAVAAGLAKESVIVRSKVMLRLAKDPEQKVLERMLKKLCEKTTIGNVAVWRGEPPDGNPYAKRKGDEIVNLGVTGKERREALRKFRDGEDTSEYTFWRAPCSGGARRITNRDEIDWTQMGGTK